MVCCLYIRWWLPAPMPHKKEYGIHFSEHNSLRTLHKLTSFGPHPSGSLEGQQVVLFLQDTVRSIVQSKLLGFSYKLEISVGDGMVDESVLRVYRNVTNLMLRLYRPSSVPSRPSQALLLSSHWDSALDSPGASDDGVGVVVMIEILRNLVDYPTLFLKSKLDLIFLWCGSEELGLLGSDVFLTHPWSKDVVSFINIEAVGAGGPEYIFQIGNNWMTEAYASSVLYPRATSLGQDFFEKKLIIGNTDYVNYKKLTENGIDMAFIENGYVYHTYRDTIQEIVPGTIQHVGDNVLSLVIYIIQNPPTKVDKIRSMYYDIFHFTVFSVPLPMGILLGWTLCLIGLSHLLIVSKLRLYPLLKILIQALTFLLGFMSSVIFSCAISHIFHLVSPIGNRTWFSKPELALVFFLPGSTLGFLFIFSISSKIMKKMGIVNDNLHNGLLAFYILVSAPILWLEMASSFYPIIFVINILLSFHLSNLFSSYLHLQEVKMWWNLFLLFMLPSNILFTDQTISLIVCYLPMMAKISNDLVHLVMALFTGTFFFFGFLPTLAYVWQHNLLKRCSKGAALILVMSIVLMLIIFPFSLHYPIRAVAYHKVEMEAQEITKNSILFSPIGNPTTRNPSLVFNEVELGFI
uniref:Peptidase M28 domain-containing protein n=2 Tax=Arcella intermedia TaxID=1963864 RepID=A0A6B2KZW4_9EUKA